MLPQQRNEMVIEGAIERVRKVLNAAENSNQAGEDLIVVMAAGAELYEALLPFANMDFLIIGGGSEAVIAMCDRARAALDKVEVA